MRYPETSNELVIRGWRVREEGPGYVVFFDPRIEHLVLYEGPDLAYEVREGREASEAGARSSQLVIDGLAECEISAKGESNGS